MTHKEVRDEIMSYVERKRDLFGGQLKAMEIDNNEEWDPAWWGGKEDWNGQPEQNWEQTYDNEIYGMQHWGKGPGQSSAGKGKGYTKGEKGGYKGGGKKGESYKGYGGYGGKGYDGGYGGKDGYGGKGGYGGKDKGKGKGVGYQGGNFHGQCHWCGEWGHSASRCKKKDEHMENLRKSKQTTDNVEETPKDGLETLESTDSWRTLCYLEENRFSALAEEDDEADDDEEKAMESHLGSPRHARGEAGVRGGRGRQAADGAPPQAPQEGPAQAA